MSGSGMPGRNGAAPGFAEGASPRRFPGQSPGKLLERVGGTSMAVGGTDWGTPGWLFEWLDSVFGFTLDAAAARHNAKCARFFSIEDDGLAQSWAGETVWLNPPFGAELARWMKKALEEHRQHGCTVVCLVPARTCTGWWHEFVLPAARVVFLRGRIPFLRPDGTPARPAPFSPALAIYQRGEGPNLEGIDLRKIRLTTETTKGTEGHGETLEEREELSAPRRPVTRWHGGKWHLAPWIIGHFPAHRTYVEPFGGAGSVLLRKERAYAEVLNDLDGEVVNLFRVLQDAGTAEQLRRLLQLTPFARAEFLLSYEPTDDPVERARRQVIRGLMGFGSDGHNIARRTGFRAKSSMSGTTPAHDWRNYPAAVVSFVERLRGVVIENRDALAVMAQHDGPRTLHYVDPPYVHATRQRVAGHGVCNRRYAVEMTDADHARLLEFLGTLTGMVVLSAYPHPLYEGMLAGWRQVRREAFADGARPRTEVLWLNEATVQGLEQERLQPQIPEIFAEERG